MVNVPGGEYLMGSAQHYPEERPVRSVHVTPFRIDTHAVTNARFAEFVAATGYVTVAEQPLDPSRYPGADPDLLKPGGLVFHQTPQPVELHDLTQWWAYVPGANWRNPRGPQSSLDQLDDHPVVQVCHTDAAAYAAWRGVRLPTEAEWEFAARGGLQSQPYTWGAEADDDPPYRVNRWRGEFPWQNSASDGYEATAPVGTFEPNGYGLYDMAGNVWEWTDTWWTHHHAAESSPCCGTDVARQRSMGPGDDVGRRVIKGGSHLCAPNYCLRYRPAARQPEAIDSATCHLGFRCATDE
ncbi:formylglycine-generating enzyme family protein [Gordonia sp. CPCC 205333]|uniref:formylglycine-generating enzyme family protein n=1 Tax=Gordonia sp. CPCC 205333 TaxID=3140790 RepID=UPI003AF3A4C7